jgi:hypothetical protein
VELFMFSRCALALGAALACASALPAHAQEKTTIVVGSRLWYSITSTSLAGASVSHTTMPFYGTTVQIVPAGWGGAAFSLTGFYGDGTGDFSGETSAGQRNLSRFDIEGLAQFPLGSAGAFWSAGLRYVATDSVYAGTDSSYDGTGIVSDPYSTEAEARYYLAELGIGASKIPLSADGSHHLFAGLLLAAGLRQTEVRHTGTAGSLSYDVKDSFAEGVVGIDANFGYAASLGPLTLSARYRLLMLSDPGNFTAPEELDFVHGPEINLSLRLN